MGLFDSVNYVNSNEIKKLYSDFNKKSLNEVEENAFEEKEEKSTSSLPFMNNVHEENDKFENAIKELIDDGYTRKQAEKFLSDIADETNEMNNSIDYITEMTGMSVEEAKEYLYQEKAVDRLQDDIYG